MAQETHIERTITSGSVKVKDNAGWDMQYIVNAHQALKLSFTTEVYGKGIPRIVNDSSWFDEGGIRMPRVFLERFILEKGYMIIPVIAIQVSQ